MSFDSSKNLMHFQRALGRWWILPGEMRKSFTYTVTCIRSRGEVCQLMETVLVRWAWWRRRGERTGSKTVWICGGIFLPVRSLDRGRGWAWGHLDEGEKVGWTKSSGLIEAILQGLIAWSPDSTSLLYHLTLILCKGLHFPQFLSKMGVSTQIEPIDPCQ